MPKAESLGRRSRLLCLCAIVQLASCGGGSGQTPNSIVSQETAAQGSAQTPASSVTPVTVPDNTADAGFTCGLANFRNDMLARVNDARASSRMCGGALYGAVPPLAWNTSLFNAAAAHTRSMATANFVSHDSLDGSSFAQRISVAGYPWRSIGENIAAGQSTVDEVLSVWLSSPGHCANIMSSAYRDIGFACVASASAAYSTYWTMDFGAPR